MAKETIGSELYSGAATFGTITSAISLIFGTLIGLFLIGIGIYMLVSKDDKNSPDPKKPNDSTTTTTGSRKTGGIISIIFGVVIILIVWVYWYFVRKSKTFAAATGAISAVDMITGRSDYLI